jgi:sigma-E factor negative regulatory protein RseA
MDKISALMDGELPRQEADRLVVAVRESSELREAWATYHLIGEALRREPCADCGVMGAVAKRLTSEPTVLAPRRVTSEFGRRWALPSMAAAAAVAAVSWMAFEMQPGAGQPNATSISHVVVPSVQPQTFNPFAGNIQSVHLPPQPTPPAPIQLTARELDAYLIAHQVISPSTTLQGLAPYVRTVTTRTAEPGR